ncbi:MAG: TetR family transcriptional regulator protein [Conexibacter sp.]|jgi:AcrR family transcriptional regulator|nr:TetR family transcriptional regulator protein [Conexibacter sp.]
MSSAGSRRNGGGDEDSTTQERILSVATGMFMRGGYEGTSLAKIAKAVGISTPALYWHFDSKEDLFIAAMEQVLVDFTGTVAEAVGDGTPVQRLSEFCRAHVLWQLEQRDAANAYAASFGFRELVASLPAKERRRIVKLQRGHVQLLREILAAGEADGTFGFDDLRVTAFAIITLCDYVFSWFDPEGSLTPEDVAEHYRKLVLAMVGAGAAARA